MATYKVKCKLDYKRLGVYEFPTFAAGVRIGIYEHPDRFPAPPFTEAGFNALIEDERNKYSGYKNGRNPRIDYTRAYDKLIEALNETAEYVNKEAADNPNTILLAGYKPTKISERKAKGPEYVDSVTLKRGDSRELISECGVVKDAEYYGAILSIGKPLPQGFYLPEWGQIRIHTKNTAMAELDFILDVSKLRKKSFRNLQAGVTYYVYYWAGNAKGVSPLSNAVSKSAVD
ncbi:MAG: hypothetical protein AB7G44_17455 [Bacteroidia bacterium]